MNTTIAISKDTRSILQDFGKKSENYDQIIRRMYNQISLNKLLDEFTTNGYTTLEEAEEWTRLKIKESNDKNRNPN